MSLIHNKYLLIFTLASILGSVTDFVSALSGYVAIHCLGSESYITLLSLATAVPVLFVVLFIPKILEKADKFMVYIGTRVATIVVSFVIFLSRYDNLVVLLSLLVVKSLFSGVWSASAVMFIADCIEYGQFRTGERNQGIAFATKAFTNKIIVAITGALGMFGIAAFGFVEGAGVVQSARTVQGIWLLYWFETENTRTEGTVLFALPKAFAFQMPEIRYTITETERAYLISLQSDCFAKGVALDTTGGDCIFSDNYFDLAPGECRTIAARKEDCSGIRDVQALCSALQINTLNAVLLRARGEAEEERR